MKDKNQPNKLNNHSSIYIPTHIFHDRSIAVLEAASEYLKDIKGLTYHQIAVLVGRNDRTIWTCYNRAKKKEREDFVKAEMWIDVPVEIFSDRKVAVLERLVEFLKETKGLSYHEIAILLNRNDRTVWTVYNRCKKKRAVGGGSR